MLLNAMLHVSNKTPSRLLIELIPLKPSFQFTGVAIYRVEVCTGMGTAGIPPVSRGCGYEYCGNTAGMDLSIAGFPRGWILLRRETRGNGGRIYWLWKFWECIRYYLRHTRPAVVLMPVTCWHIGPARTKCGESSSKSLGACSVCPHPALHLSDRSASLGILWLTGAHNCRLNLWMAWCSFMA